MNFQSKSLQAFKSDRSLKASTKKFKVDLVDVGIITFSLN